MRIVQQRWAFCLVFAVAVAPYMNSLDGGFHYDDDHALVRNTHLRQLASIPAFFVDASTFSAEPDMAMYRPLLQTTFALNYALSAYDAWSWHLVNVLLHGLAALGALALCRRLFDPEVALVAALLFALHPVQSQAVNYLSSRSEILSMGLVLWSLALIRSRRIGWSLLLYGLALLTKSAAIILLPLAALIELVRPVRPTNWLRLAPHAGLSVAYLALITLEGFLPRSLAQNVRPWDVHIWTQLKALVYYLQLCVMPHGLALEHDFTESLVPWSPVVLLSAAAAGSVLWLLWHLRVSPGARAGGETGRTNPVWLAAPWFGAGLMIPFIVPLNVLINEHRLYLPALGLALLTAAAISRTVANRALLLAILLLFGVSVVRQNGLWDNELALWTRATHRAPHSARAWSNLSLARYEDGDNPGAHGAVQRALNLNAEDSRTWNNMGLLLEQSGRFDDARSAYAQAAQRSPQFSGSLVNLGRLALQAGDLEAAEAALTEALRRNDKDALAQLHRGRLLQMSGQSQAAEASYLQALQLDPMSAAAANNLAMLRAEQDDRAGALAWLQQALNWDPDHEAAAANIMLLQLEAGGLGRQQAYERVLVQFPEQTALAMTLGGIYAQAQRWRDAVRVYRSVWNSQHVPGLHAALGQAMLAGGDADGALGMLRQAARETPSDVRIWNALAAAAAAAGALDEARRATESALQLDPENARAQANRVRLTELGAGEPKSR